MLLRECRELGLRGLKLHVTPTAEVLDTVAELRIPVIWHPARVALFDQVARDYPTVDLIWRTWAAISRATGGSISLQSIWRHGIPTSIWTRAPPC